MRMWDFLEEEGTAVLDDAAWASQFLEGDKYPTSSLVIPMMMGEVLTNMMGEVLTNMMGLRCSQT